MTVAEYREKALRTNKWFDKFKEQSFGHYIGNDVFVVRSENAHKVAIEKDLFHMLIGLSSETNELMDAYKRQDQVNISEEAADKMWYLSNLASMQQVKLVHNVIIEAFTVPQLVYRISKLHDSFKRLLIYNKPVSEEQIERELQDVADALYNLRSGGGSDAPIVDLPLALAANIRKLEKRYPEKYTDFNAANRDLDAERKALEGDQSPE